MANPRTKGRLEARILERAAYCLQFEVRDPRAVFVTLTKVELSSDLTSAKVFYSVLGDEGDRSKAAHMLESAAGFVQRQVARVLQMRRVPHLRFVYDESLVQAQRMDDLIREARRRDREINPLADESPLETSASEPQDELADDDAEPESESESGLEDDERS